MDKKTHIIWGLSSFTLFIGIFTITVFTYYNGENKDVVSHISLASSVVSIILAVLAIVYTYFQSVSMENSSKNMSSEVARLKEIIGEFKISADKFDRLDSSLQSNVEEIRAIKEKLFSKLTSNSPSWSTDDMPVSKNEESDGDGEEDEGEEKGNEHNRV